jgi:ribosomal protein S18 acetylase RimI-like enzyme
MTPPRLRPGPSLNRASLTPATAADEALVLALMREFYAGEGLTFSEKPARAALRTLLGDPAVGRVFLIGEGTEPAGYLVLTFGFSLEFHGRDGLVDELYVRAPFRGRGLGRAALAHAEAVCREEGVRVLSLEVDRSNRRARALYERSGYRDRGNHLLTKRLAPGDERA